MKGKAALLKTFYAHRPLHREAVVMMRIEVSVFHQDTGRTDALL